MTKVIEKHPYSALALLFVVVLIWSAALLGEPRTVHSASGSTAITGYLWSDNVGWIDLNCTNGGVSCASDPWGLTIDSSGNITGYAWSDNVGWIEFGDLNSFPTGTGTLSQNAQIVGANLVGWARACAGTAAGDCSSMTSRTDGWDGWISLSGSGYGATLTSGTFSGYGWGSDVVGWTSFAYATTTYGTCTYSVGYTCSGNTIVETSTSTSCAVTVTDTTPACAAPSFCSVGSATCLYPPPTVTEPLTVTPQLVTSGGTAQVSWNIGSVDSCAVSGSNKDGTASSTDTFSPGIWNTTAGTSTSSPITQQTTYTLSCLEEDNVTYFTQTATVNLAPIYQER